MPQKMTAEKLAAKLDAAAATAKAKPTGIRGCSGLGKRPRPGLNWWTGSNGNLFADAAGYRYSVGKDARGAGYWVARDGVEIGSGLTDGDYAKQVAAEDAAALCLFSRAG